MVKRQHADSTPAIASGGFELRVEVHWCAYCRAESTVQIVQLARDPEPTAICVACGTGVDMWLSADCVELSASGADRRTRHQGAA